MSELGRGWTAGILAASFITIGLGCGDDKAAPPPSTLAPTTSVAPAPPPTAPPAPPTTVPSAAAAPGTPRTLPALEVTAGADLASFSNLRWKDGSQRQVAADVKLAKGPVASMWFIFQAGDKQIASGVLPGSAFADQKGMTTIYMPAATGLGPKGEVLVPDVSSATRLLMNVLPLPQDTATSGQPAWVGPIATACDQGSAADCQTLAAAYRTGKSEHGAIKADPALAERYGKRFVEMGERGCAMGGPGTCFVLGRAYLSGDDVPANQDRGIALIQKACAAGATEACDWQVANPIAKQAKPH